MPSSAPIGREERTMRKRGRRTKYPGITDLGNGRYQLRVCIADPKRPAKEVDRVKIVKAANINEAAEKRVAFEHRLRNAQPVSQPHSQLGDALNEWWKEIKDRKHAEDPQQLHLCNATSKR